MLELLIACALGLLLLALPILLFKAIVGGLVLLVAIPFKLLGGLLHLLLGAAQAVLAVIGLAIGALVAAPVLLVLLPLMLVGLPLLLLALPLLPLFLMAGCIWFLFKVF